MYVCAYTAGEYFFLGDGPLPELKVNPKKSTSKPRRRRSNEVKEIAATSAQVVGTNHFSGGTAFRHRTAERVLENSFRARLWSIERNGHEHQVTRAMVDNNRRRRCAITRLRRSHRPWQ